MILRIALFFIISFSTMVVVAVVQAQTISPIGDNRVHEILSTQIASPPVAELLQRWESDRKNEAGARNLKVIDDLLGKIDPRFVSGLAGKAYMASSRADLPKMEILIRSAGATESLAVRYAPKLLRIVQSTPWRGVLAVAAVGTGAYVAFKFFKDDDGRKGEGHETMGVNVKAYDLGDDKQLQQFWKDRAVRPRPMHPLFEK